MGTNELTPQEIDQEFTKYKCRVMCPICELGLKFIHCDTCNNTRNITIYPFAPEIDRKDLTRGYSVVDGKNIVNIDFHNPTGFFYIVNGLRDMELFGKFLLWLFPNPLVTHSEILTDGWLDPKLAPCRALEFLKTLKVNT
ncbi:hypothetical protein KAR91_20475 [Candidatus Pacearchaeota archaeon]|nr:hypothetical protein [Candidatus Pacearchaeota archaeon]